MDRGAWWAAVHGVTKEADTTERLKNIATWSVRSHPLHKVPGGPDRQKHVLLGSSDSEQELGVSICLGLLNPRALSPASV